MPPGHGVLDRATDHDRGTGNGISSVYDTDGEQVRFRKINDESGTCRIAWRAPLLLSDVRKQVQAAIDRGLTLEQTVAAVKLPE